MIGPPAPGFPPIFQTKTRVEAYVKNHGVGETSGIGGALRHHRQALREIREDLIIPSRLVLVSEAMARIGERVARQDQPREALKALFRESRGAGSPRASPGVPGYPVRIPTR